MQTFQEKQAITALLGSLYLCKPTRDVLESWRQLSDEPVPPILSEIFAVLNQIDPASEEAVEELVWEYTRLFIGPYKLPAPPWESVYTSPKRLMMQEAHDLVQECYREAGFQVEQEGLMADHIGLELTFLSVLYQQIIETPEKMNLLNNIANDFIQNHQVTWVPRFTHDLENAAESTFYVVLAETTRKFVLSA